MRSSDSSVHPNTSSTHLLLLSSYFCIPILLLLFINIYYLHKVQYRIWRLQIMLWRTAQRIRCCRNSISTILSFLLLVSLITPFLLLITWSAILWFIENERILGISLVLMTTCLLTLYYAVQYWKQSEWRMTRHIQTLFAVSLSLYFILAFTLSFLVSSVTFFGQSIHFLTLNYLVLTEMLAQKEEAKQIEVKTLLKTDQYLYGEIGQEEDENDGKDTDTGKSIQQPRERLTTGEMLLRHKQASKRFFEKLKEEEERSSSPTNSAHAGEARVHVEYSDESESDEEDDELNSDNDRSDASSDDDDALADRRTKTNTGSTLINISPSSVSIDFTNFFSTFVHETQEEKQNALVRYQMKLYLLSLAILLGYSLAIYYGNGPISKNDLVSVGGGDDTSTGTGTTTNTTSTEDLIALSGARYLGFIVSGILLLWDACMYIYSTYSPHILSTHTKLLIMCGSRVALISFGFQGWFLGTACLYAGASVYLVWMIVEEKWPYDIKQLISFASSKGSAADSTAVSDSVKCQRFREFVSTLTNPEDDRHTTAATSSSSSSTSSLLTTFSSSRSGFGITELIFFLLTVLYFMSLCISYENSPTTQSLSSLSLTEQPWKQWELGLIVWYGVMLWFVSLVTIRICLKTQWRFTKGSHVALVCLTQALFTLGAYLLYTRTSSLLLLITLICGPLFIFSLLSTYQYCLIQDWRILSPGYMRNPPGIWLPYAIMTCGLPRSDIRMITNITILCTVILSTGLSITLGLNGSSIGWSLTFILIILLTSLLPLVKYLKTLTLDTIDYVLLTIFLTCHIAYFSVLYHVKGDELSDQMIFVLWACCLLYPTILCNILSYHLIRDNSYRLTRNSIVVLAFTCLLVLIALIITYFTLGWQIGVVASVIVIYTIGLIALTIRWVLGNYTLSKNLRYFSFFSFVLLLISGVALGMFIEDEDTSFWLLTACWFACVAFVATVGYGEKMQLIGGSSGDGSSNNDSASSFRYSPCIFPIYYYDRRSLSNPIKLANAHMTYYLLSFLMSFVWIIYCMTTVKRINIGLGLSALLLVTIYTFLRSLSISGNQAILGVMKYTTEDMIHTVRTDAIRCMLNGVEVIVDAPLTTTNTGVTTNTPNQFVSSTNTIPYWAHILRRMLTIGLDPLPALKRKQKVLRRKLGLSGGNGSKWFCQQLQIRVSRHHSTSSIDSLFSLLLYLHTISFHITKLHFQIESLFYFQLLSRSRTEIQLDETKMKSFCQWVRKEKRHPVSGEEIILNPMISNNEIYEQRGQGFVLTMQKWKEEYLSSLQLAAEQNELNRQKELEAEKIREIRMAEKEKRRELARIEMEKEEEARRLVEEQEREKREAAAAAAADGADGSVALQSIASPSGVDVAASTSTTTAPVSTIVASSSSSDPNNTDPNYILFQRAIAAYKSTGRKYEDPDFPATADSIYLSGERDTSKGSAVNQLPIDEEWKRPEEILELLARENPEQNIPLQPKLFINGFDLSDIVQGNIGTCYFLSAIGCLGIRELCNPRQPLLTDIFTMQMSSEDGRTQMEYNECGAFLVRFYRSGRKVSVLIDDRLPTSQGNFAFSHAKQLNEMWVSLLEKAYARLFTCYEAIEAGLISQALCDLSNGASEQIALKNASGQLTCDPDALWLQLSDSFSSGYLIGAGSNTGSDTTSIQGIAQGHAYMVVRIFQDAGKTERLIQLQNPHGHGEWDGDWSDSSSKWTQWWRTTLGFDAELDDGKFWMSFSDFLESYQNIYICRLLPVRKSLTSAWKGISAAGPNDPWNNPTFCVSTPTPCKVYIELEQTNKRGKKSGGGSGSDDSSFSSSSSSSDYAFIQFFLISNGGRRISKIVKEEIKGCCNKFKMMNERQISCEVFLDQPDIPYTIVCVNKAKGHETGLTLSVFCSDERVKLWQLPEEPQPAA